MSLTESKCKSMLRSAIIIEECGGVGLESSHAFKRAINNLINVHNWTLDRVTQFCLTQRDDIKGVSMNAVILKYKLGLGMNYVEMKADAEIIHVGQQNGEVTIWAMCNPLNHGRARNIEVVGTGMPINFHPKTCYVGTVQMPSGLVWHVIDQTT